MRFATITGRLGSLGSEKWALHLQARNMVANGADILEMTIGEPDMPPDTALLEECQRAMNAGRTRYSNGRGEPSIVGALARKYSGRSGRSITAENILCFPGTQTALFASMMGLVEKGDDVLVGDPLMHPMKVWSGQPGPLWRRCRLRRKTNFTCARKTWKQP